LERIKVILLQDVIYNWFGPNELPAKLSSIKKNIGRHTKQIILRYFGKHSQLSLSSSIQTSMSLLFNLNNYCSSMPFVFSLSCLYKTSGICFTCRFFLVSLSLFVYFFSWADWLTFLYQIDWFVLEKKHSSTVHNWCKWLSNVID